MLIDTEEIRISTMKDFADKKVTLAELRFILRTIDAFEVLFTEVAKRPDKPEGTDHADNS